MNIQSAVIEGTSVLKNKSIISAQLDTEILMAKALGKSREYIILNHDKVLNIENLKYFKKLDTREDLTDLISILKRRNSK